jgi:predicted dehydrogenase
MTDSSMPRVGLVGAGSISHLHLPHLLSLGADVLVYAQAGAAELVGRYGGAVAASLDELLRQVDVVDVATPTHTHYDVARQALLAGQDVICEKPLGRTDAEVTALLELAGQLGRRLFPAHVVRYFPEYVRLREAVRAGQLGDLAVLRFYRSGAAPTRVGWYADPELSGGIIVDQMIHDLDQARWLAGEVVRVSATWTRRPGSRPAEAAHVLLTHASGTITQASGIWGPPHLRFTTGYFAAGTGGVLAHDSAAERRYVTDLAPARPDGAGPGAAGGGGPGGGAVPDIDPAEDPYFLVLQDLLGAIAAGTEPRTTAADGAQAVRIATAAVASARSGQPADLTAELEATR